MEIDPILAEKNALFLALENLKRALFKGNDGIIPASTNPCYCTEWSELLAIQRKFNEWLDLKDRVAAYLVYKGRTKINGKNHIGFHLREFYNRNTFDRDIEKFVEISSCKKIAVVLI